MAGEGVLRVRLKAACLVFRKQSCFLLRATSLITWGGATACQAQKQTLWVRALIKARQQPCEVDQMTIPFQKRKTRPARAHSDDVGLETSLQYSMAGGGEVGALRKPCQCHG